MKIILLFALIFAIKAITYEGCTFTKSETTETLKFWTKEMMAKSIPMESILQDKYIDKLPLDFITADYDKKEPTTDYVKPESLYQETPYRSVGKAYFLFQGRPAHCSASSIGNNAVLTAGHCVFMEGAFHDNFVFVPQDNDGDAPAGKWAAKRLMIPEEWRDQNMGRDVAFAVVEKNERGQTLERVVGKLNIGVCDVGDSYRSFGYPGPDYGGNKMVQTIGDIQRRFPLSPWDPAPLGIRSKQGPGSSGGPWITKFQDKNTGAVSNVVCSVNSFLIRFTYYVFGPYFDRKVLEMAVESIKQ